MTMHVTMKTKYFPSDPIPSWPKRTKSGSIPHAEAVALEHLERPVEAHRASVFFRSWVFRGGEPLVCLSCGAKTLPEGDLPCGH